MRGLKNFAAAAVLAFAAAAASSACAETVAVTNARVLTMGPAGEIQNGTVVIRDGKIVAVGAGVAAPAGARVIDAQGQIVTPGFVIADSALGAMEVTSVGDDLSPNTPGLTAAFDVQYGLNPDSFLLPVARLGGITRAVVVPAYGGGGDGGHEHDTAGAYGHDVPKSLFAGQAAVVDLGQHDDMLTKARVAMTAPMGEMGARAAGGARGAEFVLLKTALDDVRFYMANKAAFDTGSARELNLSRADLEALIPVVEGRMPLLVSVHRASDIRQALRFAKQQNLKLIIDGGEEAWKVADQIAAAGVPVILNPLADLPGNFETLGSTMENAGVLEKAGVTVVIKANEENAHRAREARFNAGNAVAHGMSYAGALKALTINPAKVFGVADRFGSLEAGKDADLVIWSGDPLEPLSQPQAVFVKGEQMPLTSRALQLRDRYKSAGAMPPAYSK
ncbi:amidohydrolase family protein [Caulobacter sp. 17J80-11]|uniref:amidohydrolase family protein n=1 Tax=Caulobacter sp. 17J80-11 TaxID=2763502 RepID=UPI001653B291|nr:amidohydrolase family protein [Caulobacter sp. 17J80-11]MBC6981460.1 amidohydrolase family protein [Caulobacter sp. 17J80-11]